MNKGEAAASHLQGMKVGDVWCVIKNQSSLVLVEHKFVYKQVMKSALQKASRQQDLLQKEKKQCSLLNSVCSQQEGQELKFHL